jgi:hypothetical protein
VTSGRLFKSVEKSYALVKTAPNDLHVNLVFKPVFFVTPACLPRDESNEQVAETLVALVELKPF